jgi:hypothetical protein
MEISGLADTGRVDGLGYQTDEGRRKFPMHTKYQTGSRGFGNKAAPRRVFPPGEDAQ